MNAFLYYISLPFLYTISLLPFPVFYLFSDFLYFVLYYVIGYRKKIVFENLKNSFPEKSEKELLKIRKQFYHYLCDLFLETFKTLTISPKEMVKRCEFTPETEDLFKSYAAKKQSVIIVMGHYGNWEWAGNTFSLRLPNQLFVIYHPLANKYFDKLIYNMRTRFGTRLIAMKDTFRDMVTNKNIVSATAFIADQTPNPANAYWTKFLNQDTPVFKGTEKIAQKLDYPIVYISIKRVKRGFYKVHAHELVEKPSLTREQEITILHTRRLEKDIVENPSTWLWSHRRWKHRRDHQETP